MNRAESEATAQRWPGLEITDRVPVHHGRGRGAEVGQFLGVLLE
jgi:hypothetical protein